MSDEKDILETLREEKRSEKTGKYKPRAGIDKQKVML